MTTTAALRKQAARTFTPDMARRGFSLSARRCYYWRKVGDLYHFVVLSFTRGNEKVFVNVFAWVPELAAQPYDWHQFPDGVTMVTGGPLTRRGPDPYAAHAVPEWELGSAEACAAALSEILVLVDQVAIPWLDQIQTRDEMAKHIRKDNLVDRFGNKTADKIFGNNLIFKDRV